MISIRIQTQYEEARKRVTQQDVRDFCKYCDKKNNREICPSTDQVRYVYRNDCGWSYVNDVRISNVTAKTMTLDGVVYQKEDIETLMRSIEYRKYLEGIE